MNIQCKHCYENNIIRKGIHRAKYEDKQIYYCKSCNRKFILSSIQKKTYPPHIVISAISTYNVGHSLEITRKNINKRFKIKLSGSTIHNWIKEYSNILTYLPIRNKIIKQYGTDVIVPRMFRHSGLNYHFKFHKAKLHIRCRQTGFFALEKYIDNIYESGCPAYFGKEMRCSNIKSKSDTVIKRIFNDACKIADLSLPAARRNIERHQIIEDFMLINDASTVAVEIPVWYYDKILKTNISGHIDIIQIRGNRIHLLDYKPDARKEKYASAQLRCYAIALAYRTGIDVKKMKCAWFDESDYFMFQPKF